MTYDPMIERPSRGLLRVLWALFALIVLPHSAHAHFSYSDPRIIHVAQEDGQDAVILIRMPAPLALLPADWQGREETRLPPFGARANDETVLDLSAAVAGNAALANRLQEALTLWVDGRKVETRVDDVRFWADDARPGFGTLKSALSAFDAPARGPQDGPLPYFNATVDLRLTAPVVSLARDLRIESTLGQNFQVMDKFGTVVKLHRGDGTETQARIGTLDVAFPGTRTTAEILWDAALSGAEHIYRGLDHLAMIALIAIATVNWRQALSWASAFTLGHIITLAAGLYGLAPATAWFVPVVELSIALSIIVAGLAFFLRWTHAMGWVGMLIIGLIHGYGFAASASQALFAGVVDPSVLASFAVGLELCQFAIYALILPLVIGLDRALVAAPVSWRRAVALAIALSASTAVISRFSEASAAFGVA